MSTPHQFFLLVLNNVHSQIPKPALSFSIKIHGRDYTAFFTILLDSEQHLVSYSLNIPFHRQDVELIVIQEKKIPLLMKIIKMTKG